jgi:holliday junction DNA helicase RuvA
MIGFLRGGIAAVQASKSAKSPVCTLVVEVQGVGYEVQITANTASRLAPINSANDSNPANDAVKEIVQVFTDLQVREEVMVLYGFLSLAERDLFRQIVSVNGIGSQMAMALLNTLSIQDLVKAIVTGNTRILSLTPGVGQKTAERLALELKTKLSNWRSLQASSTLKHIAPEIQSDLETTLLALGYDPREIHQTLQSIAAPRDPNDIEAWLKAAITWLSRV